MTFGRHVLDIDASAEVSRITDWLRRQVGQALRRQGVVVGISGGVDSAVVLGLCVRAMGPQRVVALMLPEQDSDPESERLARDVAQHYGVAPLLEDITPALQGTGCYRRRDAAIRRVFPEYDADAGYTAKIVLPSNLLDEDTLNIFTLTIVAPDGTPSSKRLPPRDYAQIVAASNFKQRTRMAMLYYHAELRNYAVVGTANKNEHDQGFFVKYGDSGVDVAPIVHLYKTQVYQLARELDVPPDIQQRAPTSDTYSAPTTQEEFFFRLPFELMDLLWFAQENQVPLDEVAQVLGLTAAQVRRAYGDFVRKQRTTTYLRTPTLSLLETPSDEPMGGNCFAEPSAIDSVL